MDVVSFEKSFSINKLLIHLKRVASLFLSISLLLLFQQSSAIAGPAKTSFSFKLLYKSRYVSNLSLFVKRL